jgi:lycopene beta-cyclase
VADLVLVGGGLANGLLALRLKQLRPECEVVVVEQGECLGGNHTWSFHSSDLTAEQCAWVEPLVEKKWASHTLHFPAYSRHMTGTYNAVTSERFHHVLQRTLGSAIVLGQRAASLAPDRVVLEDGRAIRGCVIDGRGFVSRSLPNVGYQKFLGLDVTLESPHGLTAPILMDVREPQEDGFRFFYVLPWSERRLLIEETFYSDTAAIDKARGALAIEAYARKQGWQITRIDREEVGALPIPFGGRISDFADAETPRDVTLSGVRAGLFHATTGYSLPFAVRFADLLARSATFERAKIQAIARHEAEREWGAGRFFRLLNYMLFRMIRPERRFSVFEDFYRQPEALIQRFYSGRLELRDYFRILTSDPIAGLRRLSLASFEPWHAHD